MIIEIPQGSDQKLTYQHDYSVSKTTISKIFYFFFYSKSKSLNRSITEHPKQSDFASKIRVAKRKEDHSNCVDKKKIITFSDFNKADFIVNE